MLTFERICEIASDHDTEKIAGQVSFARAIEAEVLRLNGIGEGERSYACDHDDAVHCWNCYAVTPQQAAPIQERCQHGVKWENHCATCDASSKAG